MLLNDPTLYLLGRYHGGLSQGVKFILLARCTLAP